MSAGAKGEGLGSHGAPRGSSGSSERTGGSSTSAAGPEGPSGLQGTSGGEDPLGGEGSSGGEVPLGGEGLPGGEDPLGGEGSSGGEIPLGGEGLTGGGGPFGSEGVADPEGGSGSEGSFEPAGVSPPFRFFSSSSFWNVPVVGGAVLDSSSAGVVGAFDAVVAGEQQAGDGPWVNTTKYSVPVYTVGAGQAVVPVVLSGVREPSLSAAWQAVPLPAGAVPAAGTDGTLVLWQPSSDRLWEFHRLVHEVGGWRAAWGGAMQDVSSDAGVFGVGAWPGAQPWWGASASSLSLVGGLISLEDLQRGVIDHALAMAVPDVRAGVFASPAQRSDGKSGGLLALPEGAHLRLNPSLDLAALHLPRLTLMIAEAAQRYGIYVTDWSSVVEFPAQDPTPTGADPYTAPGGYFEGKYPNKLLASFPWGELQLLKMELHGKS